MNSNRESDLDVDSDLDIFGPPSKDNNPQNNVKSATSHYDKNNLIDFLSFLFVLLL